MKNIIRLITEDIEKIRMINEEMKKDLAEIEAILAKKRKPLTYKDFENQTGGQQNV